MTSDANRSNALDNINRNNETFIYLFKRTVTLFFFPLFCICLITNLSRRFVVSVEGAALWGKMGAILF